MSAEAARPGRVCPQDYRYDPSVFNRLPDLTADVLYVAGGLYGNLAALEAVEDLAAEERAPPVIVFNGDFHWFDAEPEWFGEIDERVRRHRALRGNVETEIIRSNDIGAGCGCAYPFSVDDDTVQRSNAILADLRRTVQALPQRPDWLAALPMHLVARIGALRVGIVHGDAGSLAGWGFAPEGLSETNAAGWLNHLCETARVDVFASTHTCLAALRDFTLPAGRLTIANNGAAGMPNFRDSQFGVVTRIGRTASPHKPLYGLARNDVHVDAIAVDYNTTRFVGRFLGRWPEGSPAHQSYYRRILDGPDHTIETATAHPAAAACAV
jgi:hypothetical protein